MAKYDLTIQLMGYDKKWVGDNMTSGDLHQPCALSRSARQDFELI